MANGLENAKTVVELIRDLLIGIFIGLIFFAPNFINKAFNAAGVKSLDAGGLHWESQASKAGGDISEAKIGVQDVTASLSQLATKTKDPEAQATIKDAINRLTLSAQSINSADQSIKSTVEQVQKTEPQQSQQKTLEGWMFLGHVNQAKTDWTYINAHKPGGGDPNFTSGQKLMTSDTIYLRAPTPPGQHATGQVIGVIPSGSTIEVLELDTSSHALQGGWFVWARVRSA
jgi:hypothetical protein